MKTRPFEGQSSIVTPEPTSSSRNQGADDPDSEDMVLLEAISERWPVDAKKALKALRSRVVPEHVANIFGAMLIFVLSFLLMFVVRGSTTGFPMLVLSGFSGMLAFAAVMMALRYHHRRIDLKEIGPRFHAGEFATTCPGCGRHPFADGEACCPRFPTRWSTLDLYAFWHELAAARDDGADARKQAWNRCRGPAGASAEYPRLGAGSLMRSMFRHESTAKFIVLLSAVIFVGWMILQGIFNQLTSSLILLGVLLYGLAKASLGLRRKPPIGIETQPGCRTCGYRLHPPFPERCTECGQELRAWNSITFDPDDRILRTSRRKT